jgi:glycosyltransferase involved in cell wall biosynthesis
MGARVGIIMPVYNDERRLQRTLDALAASTYKDFHLVMVDDGSSDGSVAVAERAAERIPITIVKAAHGGVVAAKRAALARVPASAEFVFHLDSDVIVPADGLERLVSYLDADPEAGVVSARTLSARLGWVGRGQAMVDELFFTRNAPDGRTFRWILGGCAMYRREAMDSVTWPEGVAHEYSFSEQLRPRWKLLLAPDVITEHLGVPTTVKGLVIRGMREGARVASQQRRFRETRDVSTTARLVPLPLAGVFALAVLGRRPLVAMSTLGFMGAYVGAFVVASRPVRAPLRERLEGGVAFTIANMGFGYGYAREWLQGSDTGMLKEPPRPT